MVSRRTRSDVIWALSVSDPLQPEPRSTPPATPTTPAVEHVIYDAVTDTVTFWAEFEGTRVGFQT